MKTDVVGNVRVEELKDEKLDAKQVKMSLQEMINALDQYEADGNYYNLSDQELVTSLTLENFMLQEGN